MAKDIPLSGDQKQRIWSGRYDAEELADAERRYQSGEMDAGAFSSVAYSYAKRMKALGDREAYRTDLAKAIEASDAYADLREDGMTAEDLDVRQTILRAAARYGEAAAAIEDGLRKYDEEGLVAVHSKALLLIGQADAMEHTNAPAEAVAAVMGQVVALAPEVEKEDPQQAIRIYRALARYQKRFGNEGAMDAAVKKARQLIKETGAGDQEIKLEADLKDEEDIAR